MKRGELHGYLYVLVAATLWGVSSVVAKSLFNLALLIPMSMGEQKLSEQEFGRFTPGTLARKPTLLTLLSEVKKLNRKKR